MRRRETLFTTPIERTLEEALEEFEKALRDRKVYANADALAKACRGARDFVDFLVEGPQVLRRYRPRRR